MRRFTHAIVTALICIVAGNLSAATAGPLTVLPETLENGATPPEMMATYLSQKAKKAFSQWEQEYENRESREAIRAYQERMQQFFRKAIGGLPERTPLNARITGRLEGKGFEVQNVLFESQPDHYVSGNLYLPSSSRFSPPYPGVVVACGHSSNGKAYEMYQKATALLALHGIAGFIFDPICQGERNQLLNEKGEAVISGSTTGHTLIGLGSMLLGRNTARFEIWDGMRAIDYLQSRSEVDGDRIGFMGNSGGGTQTAYMMALDDRIKAASPSCYITSFDRLLATIGPQDAEQVVHNQIGFGMDHADYLMMQAPVPILVCAATQDFFDIRGTWSSFRYGKRLYTRLGYPERISIAENDAEHGYRQPLREAAVHWMQRWLAGRDKSVSEPDITPFPEKELWCTPNGQTLLLDGAKSAFDLNIEYNNALQEERARLWATNKSKALDSIRRIAGIQELDQLPKPTVKHGETLQHEGYRVEKLVFKPESGIYLPAIHCTPSNDRQVTGKTLLLHEEGFAKAAQSGNTIDRLIKKGREVLAIDVRGVGETEPDKRTWYQPRFGVDGQDVVTAYLLGRSYIGMRAEDTLMAARWLSRRSTSEDPDPVNLVAVGHVAQPALHAAALESDLFRSVRLEKALVSWSNLVSTPVTQGQLVNVIHGALEVYDLPRLRKRLGDKLTHLSLVTAKGNSVEQLPPGE